MRKLINNLLDKMDTRKMSWTILITAYVIIVAFISVVFFSYRKYELWEFDYVIKESELGYAGSGQEGIFSYGPYVDIDTGNWKITVDYETEKDTKFDVVYHSSDNTIKVLGDGEMPSNKNQATVVLNVEQKIDNQSFEIRTYYPGEGQMRLKNASVERTFVFKWYIIITLITIIASIVLFKGKEFLKILDEPKQVLYFTCFYFALILIVLLSMLYMPEQSGEGLYITLNLLVILHAYGLKEKVYRYFTRRNVSTVLGSIYIIASLYALDLLLRYETNPETEMTYLNYEPNLFSFAFIGVVMIVLSLIPKKWIKRLLFGVVYYIFLLLYVVQAVYYKVFGKLFSFKDLKLAKEGSDYTSYIAELFDAQFIRTIIILILVGVVGILIIRETLHMRKAWYLVVLSIIASIIMYNNTLYGGEYGEWNSFDNKNYIYATMTNRVGAFELCGFYQYELRDLYLTIWDNGPKKKEMVDDVEQYYSAKAKVENNEMTGVLKGKNVIFCLMESIDDIALNETVMPTLYQMSQKGMYFSNMYAPIYGSAATLNSELVTNIGLYAPVDGSLVYSFADNSFPHSLANRFTNQGYGARQYHYNKPSFYSREYMNKAFGYKEYVCYQDFTDVNYMYDDILVENHDLFSTLIQDEKFFDYVITYSAHLSYDSSDPIVQHAYKQHPEYASLTSSEEMNNYFAKCRLTDDMFARLIEELRNQGLLENTVIIAVGDHYPYGISDVDKLYELSNVDKYTPLLYKVPFIVWSADMRDLGLAKEIDKVSSTIDIVPTISNLFDLGDTSVYVGNDIFNPAYDGLAYFADGSWLTKDAFYYDGNVVRGSMSNENIEKIDEYVMEQINANDNILKSDYYR